MTQKFEMEFDIMSKVNHVHNIGPTVPLLGRYLGDTLAQAHRTPGQDGVLLE